MKLLLLFILLTSILLTCSSENQRESNSEVTHATSETPSCSFNPLDGECTYYNDKSVLCSMGKCSSGDCNTGKGVLTYPSGTTLETNFKNGKIEDSISFKECGNGLKFEGILKDYTRKGKLTYPNGETYEGTIIDNKKQGKGIFVDTSGNIYEGNWKNDIRDGKFTIKNTQGNTKRTVTYINGQDDEERENQKKEANARILNAKLSDIWHKRLLACRFFSENTFTGCIPDATIIYESKSQRYSFNLCNHTYYKEIVFFKCLYYTKQSMVDSKAILYYDEMGNCYPDIQYLCQ
jgi:hypothetical protein